MKLLGVHEFCDHADQYLAAGEVLGIQRDGRLIGVYVPVKSADTQKVADLASQVAKQVEQVSAETGLSEKELVELFEVSTEQLDSETRAST